MSILLTTIQILDEDCQGREAGSQTSGSRTMQIVLKEFRGNLINVYMNAFQHI